MQRAHKHYLLSELSSAELAQQRRFVFVDLGSRAFSSSTQDFLRHYPVSHRGLEPRTSRPQTRYSRVWASPRTARLDVTLTLTPTLTLTLTLTLTARLAL